LVSDAAKQSSPTWVAQEVNVTLDGLNIADGADYFLQWTGDDVAGSGSRDEFAIDTIRLSTVPEPREYLALSALGILGYAVGRRYRRSQAA
jgi:hypothetical protein